MSENTKEQVLAAARGKFAKKDVFLDDAKKVAVTIRELSRSERDALNAKIFVTDASTGKPLTVNAQGQPDPKGEEWKYRDGVNLVAEWLAATMTPTFTVEELQGADWPESLKRTLYKEAMAINGVTIKDAAGN
jgi:hypothetical protein